jgi:hypothetical protein
MIFWIQNNTQYSIAGMKTTILVLVLWYIGVIKEPYSVFSQSVTGFVH